MEMYDEEVDLNGSSMSLVQVLNDVDLTEHSEMLAPSHHPGHANTNDNHDHDDRNYDHDYGMDASLSQEEGETDLEYDEGAGTQSASKRQMRSKHHQSSTSFNSSSPSFYQEEEDEEDEISLPGNDADHHSSHGEERPLSSRIMQRPSSKSREAEPTSPTQSMSSSTSPDASVSPGESQDVLLDAPSKSSSSHQTSQHGPPKAPQRMPSMQVGVKSSLGSKGGNDSKLAKRLQAAIEEPLIINNTNFDEALIDANQPQTADKHPLSPSPQRASDRNEEATPSKRRGTLPRTPIHHHHHRRHRGSSHSRPRRRSRSTSRERRRRLSLQSVDNIINGTVVPGDANDSRKDDGTLRSRSKSSSGRRRGSATGSRGDSSRRDARRSRRTRPSARSSTDESQRRTPSTSRRQRSRSGNGRLRRRSVNDDNNPSRRRTSRSARRRVTSRRPARKAGPVPPEIFSDNLEPAEQHESEEEDADTIHDLPTPTNEQPAERKKGFQRHPPEWTESFNTLNTFFSKKLKSKKEESAGGRKEPSTRKPPEWTTSFNTINTIFSKKVKEQGGQDKQTPPDKDDAKMDRKPLEWTTSAKTLENMFQHRRQKKKKAKEVDPLNVTSHEEQDHIISEAFPTNDPIAGDDASWRSEEQQPPHSSAAVKRRTSVASRYTNGDMSPTRRGHQDDATARSNSGFASPTSKIRMSVKPRRQHSARDVLSSSNHELRRRDYHDGDDAIDDDAGSAHISNRHRSTAITSFRTPQPTRRKLSVSAMLESSKWTPGDSSLLVSKPSTERSDRRSRDASVQGRRARSRSRDLSIGASSAHGGVYQSSRIRGDRCSRFDNRSTLSRFYNEKRTKSVKKGKKKKGAVAKDGTSKKKKKLKPKTSDAEEKKANTNDSVGDAIKTKKTKASGAKKKTVKKKKAKKPIVEGLPAPPDLDDDTPPDAQDATPEKAAKSSDDDRTRSSHARRRSHSRSRSRSRSRSGSKDAKNRQSGMRKSSSQRVSLGSFLLDNDVEQDHNSGNRSVGNYSMGARSAPMMVRSKASLADAAATVVGSGRSVSGQSRAGRKNRAQMMRRAKSISGLADTPAQGGSRSNPRSQYRRSKSISGLDTSTSSGRGNSGSDSRSENNRSARQRTRSTSPGRNRRERSRSRSNTSMSERGNDASSHRHGSSKSLGKPNPSKRGTSVDGLKRKQKSSPSLGAFFHEEQPPKDETGLSSSSSHDRSVNSMPADVRALDRSDSGGIKRRGRRPTDDRWNATSSNSNAGSNNSHSDKSTKKREPVRGVSKDDSFLDPRRRLNPTRLQNKLNAFDADFFGGIDEEEDPNAVAVSDDASFSSVDDDSVAAENRARKLPIKHHSGDLERLFAQKKQ